MIQNPFIDYVASMSVFLTLSVFLRAEDISLNGSWEFKMSSESEWLPASVPGHVHLDLMENDVIPDPFYGVNEKCLQWIGEKDWEYRRQFYVSEELLSRRHAELVMEGIDTYGDIYLNGYKIYSCDNMFREWRLDIKSYLKSGKNEIRVYLNSVFKVDFIKYLEAPFKLQAWPNNDQNDNIWLSPYARKAGYHYGWDWGPRLITAGIWKNIYLNFWDDMRIAGIQISTVGIAKEKAVMNVKSEVLSDNEQTICFTVASDGRQYFAKNVHLKPGKNAFSFNFDVKDPKLWWPNGLGEHPLYDFTLGFAGNSYRNIKHVRTGIRTLEVSRKKDKKGQEFTVKINGYEVFMKGANYVPSDNFVTRVTEDTYRNIVSSAAAVNMNMLRVWGGGIYEYDLFYDLCDEYGILVWQDMMFACGMFPADEHYLQSVSSEISDNIKRLRNHPSIALWNGNNENEISYFGWGWYKNYTEEESKIYQANLEKLFYDVIPSAIYRQDETRYYHPTSPNTGYNGRGYNMGDVHFWSVWKGAWIEEYTKTENIGRFMSEYGFQSYPEISSIHRFAEDKDWKINSEVILAHQRAKNDATRDPNFGNEMMKKYMTHYAFIPDDFKDFIYLSQLIQAEAVKVGIESHRRAKPYCMGTLYWQINDCWPAASWSSIDYYGKWKALHYYTRAAYNDILVSPYRKGDKIGVKVISDRLSPEILDYTTRIMSFEGNPIHSWSKSVNIGANDCVDVDEIEFGKFCTAENEIYIVTEVSIDGEVLSRNYYYPTYANTHIYRVTEPEFKFEKVLDGIKIKISSKALLRGLYLSSDMAAARFSDNYVTVDPFCPVTIYVKTAASIKEFESSMHFTSYNAISAK